MTNHDSVELLKECDSGVKMAVSAIDDVLPKAENPDLINILKTSRDAHVQLGIRAEKMLGQSNSSGQEPNPMAKGMSWIKTNAKLTWDNSDNTISDLITDGCDMGIKSLNRYVNKYESADNEAKNLAGELIDLEKSLRDDIGCYL